MTSHKVYLILCFFDSNHQYTMGTLLQSLFVFWYFNFILSFMLKSYASVSWSLKFSWIYCRSELYEYFLGKPINWIQVRKKNRYKFESVGCSTAISRSVIRKRKWNMLDSARFWFRGHSDPKASNNLQYKNSSISTDELIETQTTIPSWQNNQVRKEWIFVESLTSNYVDSSFECKSIDLFLDRVIEIHANMGFDKLRRSSDSPSDAI